MVAVATRLAVTSMCRVMSLTMARAPVYVS